MQLQVECLGHRNLQGLCLQPASSVGGSTNNYVSVLDGFLIPFFPKYPQGNDKSPVAFSRARILPFKPIKAFLTAADARWARVKVVFGFGDRR